jgi:hypothetical protein
MSLGWVRGSYIMVSEPMVQTLGLVGLEPDELLKFVVADFVYDRFGGKWTIRERNSPNLWENPSFNDSRTI